MNSIHAIHRNTETLYQWALDDIDGLQSKNISMSEELWQKREEVHDLTQLKNELYSRARTTTSELRYVKHELELKKEEFDELKAEKEQKDKEYYKLEEKWSIKDRQGAK